MSKRKTGRLKKSRRSTHGERSLFLMIGLVLSLTMAGGIWAQWRSLSAATTPEDEVVFPQGEAGAAASPTPALRQEHIYAGGRLLATDIPSPPELTDIGIWRPGTGTWYILNSANGTYIGQLWGTNGDQPVQADYDVDGNSDFAVWRPGNGTWYVLKSSDGAVYGPQWGQSTDKPVPGNYGGDEKTDFAVWRQSTATWYVLMNSTSVETITKQWGASADTPVPGDYDGDGRTDFAVFRPNDNGTGNSVWRILKSSDGEQLEIQWGLNGANGVNADKPVPGDYDGDGRTDIAVFRPTNRTWIIRKSSDGAALYQQWGLSTDEPVPGDYDHDGKTDIAVRRASTNTWYIRKSSNALMMNAQWGMAGDIAVPGAYNRW
ncbi:MAG: VCBS repeat-containing protein [Pyrinomonadaceae bacterium]